MPFFSFFLFSFLNALRFFYIRHLSVCVYTVSITSIISLYSLLDYIVDVASFAIDATTSFFFFYSLFFILSETYRLCVRPRRKKNKAQKIANICFVCFFSFFLLIFYRVFGFLSSSVLAIQRGGHHRFLVLLDLVFLWCFFFVCDCVGILWVACTTRRSRGKWNN